MEIEVLDRNTILQLEKKNIFYKKKRERWNQFNEELV